MIESVNPSCLQTYLRADHGDFIEQSEILANLSVPLFEYKIGELPEDLVPAAIYWIMHHLGKKSVTAQEFLNGIREFSMTQFKEGQEISQVFDLSELEDKDYII